MNFHISPHNRPSEASPPHYYGDKMSALQNPALAFLRNLRDFKLTEVIACLLLVLYVIVFVLGMQRKARQKQLILRGVIVPALQRQFFLVQDTRAEGANELVCYATGRRSCRSALGKIRLKNSHDFLSFLFLNRIAQSEDRFILSLDVLPEDTMSPFVYGVVNTQVLKSFMATVADVRAFTRQMPLEYLPKSQICLTENRECNVLTPRMVQALRGAESILRWLHISDQFDLVDLDPPDKGVRLCTLVPKTPQEIQALEELILATCELTDVLVSEPSADTVYPSREARDAAVSARLRVRMALQRDVFPALVPGATNPATSAVMEVPPPSPIPTQHKKTE